MNVKTVQMLLLGLAVLLWSAQANAQNSDWAEKMFEKTNHDFGVVARGADARYRLSIEHLRRIVDELQHQQQELDLSAS